MFDLFWTKIDILSDNFIKVDAINISHRDHKLMMCFGYNYLANNNGNTRLTKLLLPTSSCQSNN